MSDEKNSIPKIYESGIVSEVKHANNLALAWQKVKEKGAYATLNKFSHLALNDDSLNEQMIEREIKNLDKGMKNLKNIALFGASLVLAKAVTNFPETTSILKENVGEVFNSSDSLFIKPLKASYQAMKSIVEGASIKPVINPYEAVGENIKRVALFSIAFKNAPKSLKSSFKSLNKVLGEIDSDMIISDFLTPFVKNSAEFLKNNNPELYNKALKNNEAKMENIFIKDEKSRKRAENLAKIKQKITKNKVVKTVSDTVKNNPISKGLNKFSKAKEDLNKNIEQKIETTKENIDKKTDEVLKRIVFGKKGNKR
ncbi:MAG: hypothetical protein BWY78_00211 [Alphaproteobacteria bacterium ADurb.Bin438]|nr:MAG: hypothetical protein BWY78_00211 [Alphaproteobacteria bacterium ADurb.Bin438]